MPDLPGERDPASFLHCEPIRALNSQPRIAADGGLIGPGVPLLNGNSSSCGSARSVLNTEIGWVAEKEED
jgi:hypothetical protein